MSGPSAGAPAGFGRGLLPSALKPLAGRLASLPFAFRAWELYAASRYPRPPATDGAGLPIPDRLRMVEVVGHADWPGFLATGAEAIDSFDGLLTRHGGGFARAGTVLDFGCGCGRLVRHLPARTDAALYGTDLNARLADWCAQNLPGRFSTNGLRPPLAYQDAQFDVMYALSVFTHLREETQRAWLVEFARILKPGGLALITFHDEHQPSADEALRVELAKSGFLVRRDVKEGSNLPASYQTHTYMRRMAAGMFDVLETVESTETPFVQAMALLRRKDMTTSNDHA